MDKPPLEGTVTILFTDVEGSTDLGSRAGDDAARGIMRSHDSIVRSCIAAAGGHEIKTLGDGFMVGFSSARRALQCAVDIQRAMHEESLSDSDAVRVRIGLNAGEVIHEDGDMFGSAVSATARIQGHAKGGEILVSEVVKALVGNLAELEFEDRGHVDLKGFDEPWRLYEAKWHKGDPVAGVRRTPFVGRESEREELRRHLDAISQHGGLVIIGGEPGVGKTRLAEELLSEARRREYRALVGRCYESDAPAPYLPFVELLEAGAKDVDRDTFRIALGDAAGEVAKVMPQIRTMYDDIPPPLEIPPEQERRYLFNSISEFIARAGSERPLVVLLDDLHWADESSLMLLQHVARRLADVPVLVLGTYRDAELDASRPLAATIERLVRERLAVRMSLGRLPRESIRTMLAKLSDSEPPDALVDAIYAETDGNAFFVEEVFAHLSEEGRLFDELGQWRADLTIEDIEVPESIRLVVGRRLQRLDEEAQKVLTLAAAVGRDFDFALLERLEEFDPDRMLDAIEVAERAGLILPSLGTRFRFAHELIRQTLLASVSLPRRQRMHLRIGEALAKLHASDLETNAAEIAAHFVQAGASDTARTIDLLMLAGNRAIEAAAFDEALRYFEDALSLEPEDVATRADLLHGIGLAQRAVGRLDDGVRTWQQALQLYEELGDVSREVSVIVAIANELSWAGRWQEAVELAARGLQLIGDGKTADRARLLSLTAIAIGGAGLYENGMQLADEAIEIAESIDDDLQRSLALGAKEIVHWGFNQFEEAVAAAVRAEPLLEGTAEMWTMVNVIGFKVWSLGALGRIEESLREIPRLMELSERVGHAGGLLMATRTQSMVTAFEDLDQQLYWAREDLRLNEENGLPWSAQSQYGIGRALLAAGQIDEGLERMRIGMETDPPGMTWGYALGFYFRSLAIVGRRAEAEGLIERIRGELPAPDALMSAGRTGMMRLLTEGLFELGIDAPDLLAWNEAAMWSGATLDFMGRPTEMYLGLAAAIAGDRWKAEDHLQRAADYSKSLDKMLEHAACLRFKGVVAVRAGDRDSARSLLAEAAETFARLGYVFYETLCRDALGSLNP